MQANTFDVIPKRKHITFFKLGKLWVFKQFFDNHELFKLYWTTTTKTSFALSSSPPARGTMPSSSWSATASTTTWRRV
jgi:hypothetical protein